MKSLTLLAGVLSVVTGRFAFGGCPTLTSIPWSASMLITSDVPVPVYLQYVDTLIYNGYTLGMLLFNSSYSTLDCLYNGNFPLASEFNETDYTD